MSRLVWLLLGAAAALAALGAAGLLVVETGAFDARASTPHDPLTAWATHTAMIHAMRSGAAGVAAPAGFTPAQTLEGVRVYDRDCVSCHGGPGVARAPWVQGMNPSPPYLLDASRRWTRSELYWIVSNGVKMTGMPAWGASESAEKIWDTVAFLEVLPDLKPVDYQRLHARDAAAKP